MSSRPMKIFAYAARHPQATLAVTDDGGLLTYGELEALSGRLGAIVGHRLVFVLCRNTPGSLLGYLGLLQVGGAPLLLDAQIAPQLLRDLMKTYHPAFCLVPADLPAQTMDVLEKATAAACMNAKSGAEAAASDKKVSLSDLSDQKAQPTMRIRDYVLYRTAAEGMDPVLAPDLRLLLTTSGSTGSSKLVRISGDNLDANAASIVEYLQITKGERPITLLPMQYSYGMSIIHTHVMAGAPIILTKHTLLERRFWDRVREEHVTSLCGVPYTFEMYDRLGLMDMDLPDLRYITQAGGKLTEKRHMQYARWCAEKGIRFYVMYGQTEASPRMGWLPPDKAIEKCGSMGIAIPGGTIELIDGNGRPIPEPVEGRRSGGKSHDGLRPDEKSHVGLSSAGNTSCGMSLAGNTSCGMSPAGNTSCGMNPAGNSPCGMSSVGELVYTGPNVALGYALCAEDLSRGDEFRGCLHTGDMARRDADGYFYIVGRKKRFIKMGGKRIGLDEVEKILRTAFPGLDLACAGKDDDLHVYVVIPEASPVRQDVSVQETEDADADAQEKQAAEEALRADRAADAAGQWARCLRGCIEEMTGIPDRRVRVLPVREIPRSSSGKIRYAELK